MQTQSLVLLILITINLVNSFQTILVNVNYTIPYKFTLNESVEYILEFSPNEQLSKKPIRVTINSNDSTADAPLMIVARQRKELLSWQLPLLLEYRQGFRLFRKTSRTLCKDISNRIILQHEINDYYSPIVTVSTASTNNVTFEVEVEYEKHFRIHPSVEYNFSISPSEPRYYFYNFSTNVTKIHNSNYDTVILEVFSTDNYCMTISIQNISCPVFDMNEDITFRGFYETVNTKGGITIPKYKFPLGFYVVFVVKTDDHDCLSNPPTNKTEPNDARIKNITLIIKPSISYDDYVNAIIITLLCIGGFYFIFGVGFFIVSNRNYRPRQMEFVTTTPIHNSTTEITPTTMLTDNTVVCDNISINEIEYDSIIEIDTDREIRLTKTIIYLNDLARKDPRLLKYNSYLYLYNILIIALFYGLPVIQLVITYQIVLNNTGQQDLCYYNFLCAHPLGFLSDFNHLFSNIGYILFGILFIWIVRRREITHNDLNFDRNYGIPQHYGMFYAMGVGLVMEGILSGSYHICPNKSNFQFDSSFMYIMAVLCMVKLYQNRHPDINAKAYTTYSVLAIAILLGMIGILEGNLLFWIIFTIIYLLTCFYLSAQIYFMGCWKFDRGLLLRTYRVCLHDFWSGPLNVLIPKYKARMCLLILGNLCNWALAALGMYQQNFALHLLTIFMANTLLYFSFYIFMKYLNKEKVNKLSWFFLLISVLCAVSAMYFFLNKSIAWSKTPAESRQFNHECKLLRFYDDHDIWHFLSAIGMFFTFMVLLTLDDDLSHTHRCEIRVF